MQPTLSGAVMHRRAGGSRHRPWSAPLGCRAEKGSKKAAGGVREALTPPLLRSKRIIRARPSGPISNPAASEKGIFPHATSQTSWASDWWPPVGGARSGVGQPHWGFRGRSADLGLTTQWHVGVAPNGFQASRASGRHCSLSLSLSYTHTRTRAHTQSSTLNSVACGASGLPPHGGRWLQSLPSVRYLGRGRRDMRHCDETLRVCPPTAFWLAAHGTRAGDPCSVWPMGPGLMIPMLPLVAHGTRTDDPCSLWPTRRSMLLSSLRLRERVCVCVCVCVCACVRDSV